MLPIAGQTAGLIGVKLFVDTHGWFPPPTPWAKNVFNIFFSTALQLFIHKKEIEKMSISEYIFI